MPEVQVLLSTYNGAKYLTELIESVLRQSYHKVKLLVRDDGSTDNTRDILNHFQKQYPSIIQVIWGDNIGIINSFLTLLNVADPFCEYFCFCDQDDVWIPDKIERALSVLGDNTHLPAMVCTSTHVVDVKLHPLNIWPKPPAREPSFYNAMIQNIAVGTTITMNKKARELIVNEPVHTENIQMHDWWAYLCISAFGKVIFDPQPSILYRQHGNNSIGGETTLFNLLVRKWNSFTRNKGKHLLRRQAAEFNRIYGDLLDEDKRAQLLLFLKERETIKDRIAYLLKCKVYRNSSFENLLFKFLILIGHI